MMRKKELPIKKSTSKTKIGVAGLFGIGAVVAAAILLLRNRETAHTCDTGQHWDETLKLCVDDTHTCPTGQHWNGTACVADTNHTCPTGQHWDTATSRCVDDVVLECPTGQHPAAPPDDGVVMGTCVPDCPSGYHWDGGSLACVSNDHWCGVGSHWDEAKGMCVLDAGYSCPTGTHWDGEACVSCASGWEWNEQLLQCVMSSPCPSGQHWDSNRGICVPNVANTCPSGQFMLDGACTSLDLNGDGAINILDLTTAKVMNNSGVLSDEELDIYTQAWLFATFGY